LAGGGSNRDGHAYLAILLSDAGDAARQRTVILTDRDKLFAATLIQWLGSPSGQGFYESAIKRAATP